MIVATIAVLLSGCGGGGTATTGPSQGTAKLDVKVPWRDGGRIPRRYTCDGADMTPIVGTLTRVPGAKQFAFVMTDPDAPGGTLVHWVRWGTTEGKNGLGKVGYSGPCPAKGAGPHHYVMTVYALRSLLQLPAGTGADKAISAIRATSIASGKKTGLYSR
jgi:phosphatidylethanolamine-binding protein (PEBP) family uncharacterized protein